MRNPHLAIKFLKGAAIHPKLKLFIRRSTPLNRLEKEFKNLNLNRGVGLGEGMHKKAPRKALKFNF
jgi:hypothetical protein